MVEHMREKRQQCSKCSPRPTWVTELDSTKMNPEVSYGIPFRWSASRLLASDLKSIICNGNHVTSEECNMLIHEANWTMDKFAEYFVSDVRSLLRNISQDMILDPDLQSITSMNTPTGTENDLWNGTDANWVACKLEPNTTNPKSICYGKISKSDWYGPDRAGACVNEYINMEKQGLVNSATVPLDLCTINDKMNELCQVLQQAQKMVFEGNCIFAGGCSPHSYVYTPGLCCFQFQFEIHSEFYNTIGVFL